MKSTSGTHFVALDHLRALATFMVFVWHFAGPAATPQSPPFPPLTILSQGYTGVAVFMTLSGFLFARLLEGKTIYYAKFLWNRALRLLPLLITVFAMQGIILAAQGFPLAPYLRDLLQGVVRPCWPNGGWSIAVELHFYLLLPLILWLFHRYKSSLYWILFATILCRLMLWAWAGEVQRLAYFTLVGRLDQFLLGVQATRWKITGGTGSVVAALALTTVSVAFYCLEASGGFYNCPSFPSPRVFWAFLPTVEALCYSLIISWYSKLSFSDAGIVSKILSSIGCYSYSLYLLHFFFVEGLRRFCQDYMWPLDNVYIGILTSLLAFAIILPFAWVSYTFIESPWLRLRVPYVRAES